ncbi:hypothetical protein [Sodalinema gerasimenkoae]|uniref:hypothetical protein n=1 Tax=Sodalinema gerasimenkoae TaxID=2862348 RepID=UPI001357F220|nr:hypothetical protein [Sodalinema gerasimenkoae]
MELKSTQPPNPQTEAKYIAENLRESHPELNHPPQPPRLWERRLKQVVSPVRFIQNLLFANPQDFHGRVYVTPELQEHSNLTARVISVASLFNAITNQPLLFFAFKDFAGVAAILASLTLNLLLIKFTNDNGTAVAGRKYGNQSWAKAGAAAMIAMSVLQSFAAGVGMEAMNNRPYLAELKAQEEIERQTENLQAIPATSEALEAAQQEFQQLQGELVGIPRENPNWDTLHVQLYGTWAERDRDWSQVPLENLPLQQRVFRLERQAQVIKEEAQQAWGEKLAQRQQLGDDVLFLQQHLPGAFARHFDDDYELKSGTEIVRLAVVSLYQKVLSLDVASLGFPLFFFLLSVVTSGIACWLTLAHAQRQDVQISRDEWVSEAIQAQVEAWIRAADDGSGENS